MLREAILSLEIGRDVLPVGCPDFKPGEGRLTSLVSSTLILFRQPSILTGEKMARLEDIPEPTRTAVASLACQPFDTSPFVSGPALAQRRVALVSCAVGGRLFVPVPYLPV